VRALGGGWRGRGLTPIAVSLAVHAVLLVALAVGLRGIVQAHQPATVMLELAAPAQPAADPPRRPQQAPEADAASGSKPLQASEPDPMTAPLDGALRRTRAALDASPGAATPGDRAPIDRGPRPRADLLDRGAAPAGGGTLAAATPAAIGQASFAGVRARRASSVVYAVDVSGAMITTLPFVIAELQRSVNALASDQRFGVVLFGLVPGEADASGEGTPAGVRTFPDHGLVPASGEHKRDLAQWLGGVRAAGSSNPLDGLLAALEARPDVVFLLSRSIRRTGEGDWGRGREAILAELDRVNPITPSIFGPPGRAVQIKCVQFIEEDPTGVMRAIAREHGGGGGEGSYRLLGLEEIRR